MDELEQTGRQFWMPALVAALIVVGGPIGYVVGWVLYMALTGQGLD